jgi:N-acetylglucosamine-6-phosphate deacetylase
LAIVLLARQMMTPLERIEDAALVIDDGTIAAVGRREDLAIPAGARTVDFGDAILAPGMIDIHVHGGAGHDVMEGSDDGLAAVEQLMALHGVTSYCPTTVTAPMDETLRALEKLARTVEGSAAAKNANGSRAQSLGMHLEGPFLSQARRGVHPSMYLQAVSTGSFNRMWDAADGKIRMLTIAPELDGALDLISDVAGRGVCVGMGHSNADLAQATAGIKAGARHATHTFNAMRRLDHRDPGLLGAILTDDAITADIVVDGIHVEPAVVDLFMRAKGMERAVLITDGISATGMPDGMYRLGSFEVQVRGGRCESHGKLAGSILTLDFAVVNTMRFAGISFQRALQMATLNPARVLGLEHRKGVLQAGADADIVVFTSGGEVRKTIVGGAID